MREYLFRGKRINNGEWVYGYFTYNCVDHLHIARIERSTGSEYGEPVDYITIDEKTVGQFTGLYDKNGNKIFEGDILEFNDEYGIWRASVVFTRGLFGIDVYNKKQIKNPENWDREYPITQSRGWGCTWGYEEFGTAFSHRKPLAQITIYKGKEEDYENSDYYKLHEKCGWGNYFTMSAEIIGNIYDNPELLEK